MVKTIWNGDHESQIIPQLLGYPFQNLAKHLLDDLDDACLLLMNRNGVAPRAVKIVDARQSPGNHMMCITCRSEDIEGKIGTTP